MAGVLARRSDLATRANSRNEQARPTRGQAFFAFASSDKLASDDPDDALHRVDHFARVATTGASAGYGHFHRRLPDLRRDDTSLVGHDREPKLARLRGAVAIDELLSGER